MWSTQTDNMQSHKRRVIMQQTVIQRIGMSLISIYELSKKQDKRDEYTIRITCSNMIRIIHNKENQSCQYEWDIQKWEYIYEGEQDNYTIRRVTMQK